MLTNQLPDRRLILISGPQSQALLAAEQLMQRSELNSEAIYRHQPGASTQSELGRDFAVVLVNAYQGLNPDAIGRVSGSVIAGGALIIVCPDLSEWASFSDPEKNKLTPYATAINEVGGHYLARWVRIVQNIHGQNMHVQNRHGPACVSPDEVEFITPIKAVCIDTPAELAITHDQKMAVEAICKAATARRKHPAIITAARGRGKSAALGLAAATLIREQHCRNIIVTSSGLGQLKSLFKHALAALPGSQISADGKTLQHSNGCLRFVTADTLAAQTVACEMLLVDEAASLGVTRLMQLLQRYPRLAFSSTEHGYEGSGRGFSLKFRQLIQQYCRGTYPATLSTPIRWNKHDPLEAWTNDLLLLQTDTQASHPTAEIVFENLIFEPISGQVLAQNETLLKNIFALLVDAHYQTRPIDLRYLLDAPNTQLWVAQQNDRPIGLVWIMHEGGLDEAIAIDIVAGRRRPQGHLAPQILGAHLGLESAITLRCARIQRIVVQPDLQNQGLGSWMLQNLQSQLQSQPQSKVDYLASSFGADLPLSRFWMRAGYQAVRLSDQPHAASGLRSALVIKPLSNQAEVMANAAACIFSGQLRYQLTGSLNDMSASLALELAPHSDSLLPIMEDDLKAASLFAYALRPYESSLSSLAYLAMALLFKPSLQTHIGENQSRLFIARILQNQSWDHCAQHAGLSGKKACLDAIRQSARAMLEQLYPGNRLKQILAKYMPAGTH